MSTLQCTLHWIMRYIGPPKVIFKGNMQTLLSQIEVISLFQLINLYKYIVSRLEMWYTFGVLSKLLD